MDGLSHLSRHACYELVPFHSSNAKRRLTTAHTMLSCVYFCFVLFCTWLDRIFIFVCSCPTAGQEPPLQPAKTNQTRIPPTDNKKAKTGEENGAENKAAGTAGKTAAGKTKKSAPKTTGKQQASMMSFFKKA